MRQIVAQSSGLPPERVIGTGTMLDTARLRQTIGEAIGVDARSVHAPVVGEHGDSAVVLWSSAHVGGLGLRDWPGWTTDRETASRGRGADLSAAGAAARRWSPCRVG